MKVMKCTHSSPQSTPVTASRLHFLHRDEQQKPSSAKFLGGKKLFTQKNTTLITTMTRRTKCNVADSNVSKIGNAVVERAISVECGLYFEIFTGLLTVRGIVDSTGSLLPR